MDFTGEYLKSVRLKKKISLESIAKELNISTRILEEIENDFYEDKINYVYIIGHIRAYSRFLKLDHNKIIENFKVQISYDKFYAEKKISKPIHKINILSVPKFLSIASTSIIIFGFYFLFVNNNDLQHNYAMTPDIPESLKYEIEKIEMEISLSRKALDNANKLEVDQENTFFNKNDMMISNSSALASLPISDLKNSDSLIILKFINPTWIQIRNNQMDIIISKLMSAGDEYSYYVNNNYSLTAGNAGNIIVAIDGIIKGKVGKSGEVIDALIIDNKFSN